VQLLRYQDGNGGSLGVVKGDKVISIERALEHYVNPDGRLESRLGDVARVLGREPKVLLGLGPTAVELVAEAVAADDGSSVVSETGLAGLKILPFIHNPMKVFGMGYNNKKICEHENKPYPEHPEVFAKMPTCVIGPYDDVNVPKVIAHVDLEGEVCVVIGRRANAVPRKKALEYVGGYIVMNEACAKILPRPSIPGRTETLGLKGPDDMAPLGAVLVTADEIKDPAEFQIVASVNGEERQNYSLSEAVFDVAECIEYVSARMTLHPGDLIAMGTGLGCGILEKPIRLLKDGDVVECAIVGYAGCKNTFRIPGWKSDQV
jgi:2-keto-4-pentenoate hydratase/2-oxohepta-3-ene-1,7-dioic acid hydratase in catechol pathway